jgi:hypothetical protein
VTVICRRRADERAIGGTAGSQFIFISSQQTDRFLIVHFLIPFMGYRLLPLASQDCV